LQCLPPRRKELANLRVQTGLHFSISGSPKAEKVLELAISENLFDQKIEKALF
jgi:hypothetical protein